MGKKVDLNSNKKVNNNPVKKKEKSHFSSNNFNKLSPSKKTHNGIRNQNNSTNQYYEENQTPEIDDVGNFELSFPIKNKIVLTVLLISIPFILLLVFISVILSGAEIGSGVSISGYYDLRCDEITVTFTDKENNYEATGTATYSLDDYVAGVVYAEVGMFNNKEIYKVFALAARSYVQEQADDNCAIESSDRKQVFKDITGNTDATSKLIYEAVEETTRKVLMLDKEILSVRYDAFCSIDKDEDYYTIKQQEQKIPTEWVDRQTGIAAEWKLGTCQGNHGEGISQWGAYYLATEEEYTYDEIIAYYYGDEVTISTPYISSIAGLDIKNTRNASYQLNMPIEDFLASKGSSLDHMNTFIKDSVNEVGPGTRESVVVAAVSMINFLYDNFNAKLPYDWGGSYNGYGIPSSFGKYSPSAVIRGSVDTRTYYNSFDCSGFVSWSIKNGGYKFSRVTTSGFHNLFSGDSCSISSSNCIGQPGDLINSKNSHVELIIGVNEENGTYYVAQSTGGGVIMNERKMHQGNGPDTRILFLESYYTNEANVDQNYPE